MREILFRGKRVDNGEWVYGNLNYGTIEIESIKDSYFISDFNVTPWDKKFYSVISETVGQYTGLTDKNGRKIFEDDVLNVHDQIPTFDGYNTDEIIYNGKVMYIKNQGMYVCEGNNDGNALCALNLDECEVIGNIHDNPELLEEKE